MATPGSHNRAADEICETSLRNLVSLLHTRQLSAREVMTAYLCQIQRWNPHVNAIVAKLDDEACLALADAADTRIARGQPVGPLHGLPWAFKDLEPAVGFPCTRGSPIFRKDLPTADSALVERLRKAGVLPIGKTNTSEFGLGSHTYNSVYGITRNPYDLSKSAGGSSGGAGAGVAARMLPAADGSDFAGSIRNPASFNNVVGFRPTVGLVPMAPTTLPLFGFVVKGPIARSVRDVGYLLSVMAGPDRMDPTCMPSDPTSFAGPLERNFKDVRVAWCPDLGSLPLERSVRAVLERYRHTFETLGCIVEEAHPELGDVDQPFLTLRAFRAFANFGSLLAVHRCDLKPEAIQDIEDGARLTPNQIAGAMVRHGEILDAMRRFQESYPFVLSTVSQVSPFDASLHWPTHIDGAAINHYTGWMKSAYWITATYCPAISVPAGFTAEGLPIGLQITGRRQDDLGVLQLAHAFEQATGVGARPPRLVSLCQ
jgi:amidase